MMDSTYPAYGLLVDQFDRKKGDVKHRLNDIVDDLFGFLLGEVATFVTFPKPNTTTSQLPRNLGPGPLGSTSNLSYGYSRISGTQHQIPQQQQHHQPVLNVLPPQLPQQQQSLVSNNHLNELSGTPGILSQRGGQSHDLGNMQFSGQPGILGPVARSVTKPQPSKQQQLPQHQPQPPILTPKSDLRNPTLPNSQNRAPSSSTTLRIPRSEDSTVKIKEEILISDDDEAAAEHVKPKNLQPTLGSQSPSLEFPNLPTLNERDDLVGGLEEDDEEDCQCEECLSSELAIIAASVKVEIKEYDDEDEEEQLQMLNQIGSMVSRTSKRTLEDVDDDEDEDDSQGGRKRGRHPNIPSMLTLGLSCPIGGCSGLFENKSVLQEHIRNGHGINHVYTCRVRGCGETFVSCFALKEHIQQGPHQNQTEYACALCHKNNFSTYETLLYHHNKVHEEGHFKCSIPSCPFVAPFRVLVAHHIRREHNRFLCSVPNCQAAFNCMSLYTVHQRSHSQVKPYRCTYPGCPGFSFTQTGSAIRHIRTVHFNLPKSVKMQREMNIVDDREPTDYLEVQTELLGQVQPQV